MKNISVSEKFKNGAPLFKGLAISCNVKNSDSSPLLWEQFEVLINKFTENYVVEQINKRPAIKATRDAYKAFGKDPNRYRPSSEALCRRILKDKDLYKINTLVDLINYVSIETGYSIGGFDEDKIKGECLTLGVGEVGETFNGIGRGPLNIDGLTVYRDEFGGIGSPTSDEERTKISPETSNILIVIN